MQFYAPHNFKTKQNKNKNHETKQNNKNPKQNKTNKQTNKNMAWEGELQMIPFHNQQK